MLINQLQRCWHILSLDKASLSWFCWTLRLDSLGLLMLGLYMSTLNICTVCILRLAFWWHLVYYRVQFCCCCSGCTLFPVRSVCFFLSVLYVFIFSVSCACSVCSLCVPVALPNMSSLVHLLRVQPSQPFLCVASPHCLVAQSQCFPPYSSSLPTPAVHCLEISSLCIYTCLFVEFFFVSLFVCQSLC